MQTRIITALIAVSFIFAPSASACPLSGSDIYTPQQVCDSYVPHHDRIAAISRPSGEWVCAFPWEVFDGNQTNAQPTLCATVIDGTFRQPQFCLTGDVNDWRTNS